MRLTPNLAIAGFDDVCPNLAAIMFYKFRINLATYGASARSHTILLLDGLTRSRTTSLLDGLVRLHPIPDGVAAPAPMFPDPCIPPNLPAEGENLVVAMDVDGCSWILQC